MNGEGGRIGNAVGAIGAGKWIVAITVMLPTLIEIIDTSVANVALDHIRGSLSSGIDESAWVLTSYLVSNAVIIPMTGWLARPSGRKRFLPFPVLLFTFASLLCGSSTSLGMLVFFRVLQGIGGGGAQPMSQGELPGRFPPGGRPPPGPGDARLLPRPAGDGRGGAAADVAGDPPGDVPSEGARDGDGDLRRRRHVRPHRRTPDGRVHHGRPLVAVDLLRQNPDRAPRGLHGQDVHPGPPVPPPPARQGTRRNSR